MLDEDLFAFGLSLPHRLKVSGSSCKTVLRKIAQRRLPADVADKPKKGFCISVDTWVDADFEERVRDVLLGKSSSLPEFFNRDYYYSTFDAFCDGRRHPGISRAGLYQRVVMLLSVEMTIQNDNHHVSNFNHSHWENYTVTG
jgi:asparagine synthase (glutamine-hydrolysing)